MIIFSKDRFGGLIFLFLSIVYGYYSYQIPLLPGDEYEAFNAQTVPKALSVVGIVLSIILILQAKTGFDNRFNVVGYKFSLASKLLLLVVLFAFSLEWVGFLMSTALFLISGFWILGERRLKTLLSIAIPFAFCAWFILSQLLDIYLAPGKIFQVFFTFLGS